MAIPDPAIFITATIYKHINLLGKYDFNEIILSSLNDLHIKGLLTIYAFVLMPNHIHLIWREHPEKRKSNESIGASFFKYSAHQFLELLKTKYPGMLSLFQVEKSDRKYQFWNRSHYTVEIYSDIVFEQKLNYIHGNPTQQKWQLAGSEMDYKYSSVRFYENGIDEFGFLTNYFWRDNAVGGDTDSGKW